MTSPASRQQQWNGNSSKPEKSKVHSGKVENINTDWRNELRLLNSNGTYLGFARISDVTGGSTPTSKPDSKWKGTPALKRGSKGPHVTELQTLLSAKYYYPDKGAKNNGIDGDFGAMTEDATKRFQMMHGLVVDGEAGAATYKELVR